MNFCVNLLSYKLELGEVVIDSILEFISELLVNGSVWACNHT